MRCRVVGLCLIVLSVFTPVHAQTWIYNPTAIQFDAPTPEEWAAITDYRLEWWNDTMTVKLFDYTVPRDLAYDYEAPLYKRIRFSAFPAPTVGATYRLRLRAISVPTETCPAPCISEPSTFAPQWMRLSNCWNAGTGRNEPVVVTYTGPLSIQAGAYLVLPPGALTITAPNPVRHVVIEAQGDLYPAMYYTVEDARTGPPLVLGPFRRAGSYPLEIRAVDVQGCEGIHPFPFPRITVTP